MQPHRGVFRSSSVLEDEIYLCACFISLLSWFCFWFSSLLLGSEGDLLSVEPEFTPDCSVWVCEFGDSVACRSPLSFPEMRVKLVETARLGLRMEFNFESRRCFISLTCVPLHLAFFQAVLLLRAIK